MRVFTLGLLIMLLFSCQSGMGVNDLQEHVRDEIENSIQKKGMDVEVTSFVLTHVSGNEYVGVLETNESGETFTYEVNVIYDGETFVWEIPATQATDNTNEGYEEVNESSSQQEANQSVDYGENEDLKNMTEAMENISDPSYCSLCQGSGIEKNRARGMGLGDDEYGRVCPMCNGAGYRTY